MNKDEMRAEIKRIEKLNAPGIALHLKYKKFWDDNHPPAGARPSKVGVEATEIEIGDWCWLEADLIWVQRLFGYAHTGYPGIPYVTTDRRCVRVKPHAIVYPIAEPVER